MGTLILKLAGPLQSWGAESRFTERKTRREPTKSGIVGLLASALGRRRTESVDDLAVLPMGVRVDQRGLHECDFQTARREKFNQKTKTWSYESLPLSSRYYLSDAVFMVGIEVPDDTLPTLVDALRHPAFPLYLGRRSCPPATKILFKACPGATLVEALREIPWQASLRYARRNNGGGVFGSSEANRLVKLELVRDPLPSDSGLETRDMVCDIPTSFSQEHRAYQWRTVIIDSLLVANPYAQKRDSLMAHDPFAGFGKVDG
ncbi:MAG: type I-E CRISPR-associated protein Cas5/CasD [Atopobiaceae bacterium]|nr:type I-E CRISPR-associated protein Cas5/CasD [Atopobiaceae bacterium]